MWLRPWFCHDLALALAMTMTMTRSMSVDLGRLASGRRLRPGSTYTIFTDKTSRDSGCESAHLFEGPDRSRSRGIRLLFFLYYGNQAKYTRLYLDGKHSYSNPQLT